MKKLGKGLLFIFGFVFVLLSLASCSNNTLKLKVLSDSMARDENKYMLPEWDNYEIKGFASQDILEYIELDDEGIQNLKIGDVIVFMGNVGGQKAEISHRIVDIRKDSQNNLIFVTQGDKIAQYDSYNKNASDTDKYIQLSSGIYEEIAKESIIGKVVSVIYKNK